MAGDLLPTQGLLPGASAVPAINPPATPAASVVSPVAKKYLGSKFPNTYSKAENYLESLGALKGLKTAQQRKLISSFVESVNSMEGTVPNADLLAGLTKAIAAHPESPQAGLLELHTALQAQIKQPPPPVSQPPNWGPTSPEPLGRNLPPLQDGVDMTKLLGGEELPASRTSGLAPQARPTVPPPSGASGTLEQRVTEALAEGDRHMAAGASAALPADIALEGAAAPASAASIFEKYIAGGEVGLPTTAARVKKLLVDAGVATEESAIPEAVIARVTKAFKTFPTEIPKADQVNIIAQMASHFKDAAGAAGSAEGILGLFRGLGSRIVQGIEHAGPVAGFILPTIAIAGLHAMGADRKQEKQFDVAASLVPTPQDMLNDQILNELRQRNSARELSNSGVNPQLLMALAKSSQASTQPQSPGIPGAVGMGASVGFPRS